MFNLIDIYDDIQIKYNNYFDEKEENDAEDEDNAEKEENENDEEEEDEIKIYSSDYPPKKHKKRWNTTFKKNIKRNQLTKKNYLVIDDIPPLDSI